MKWQSGEKIMQSKLGLREEIVKKRESMSKTLKEKNDEKIHDRLFQDKDFENSKEIFIYLSYKSEINTYKIIKKSFMLNKKIAIPKTIFRERAMDFIHLKDYDDIDKIPVNKMGIREPLKGEVLIPTYNTIIIVPGLAFTLKGERLGYGGGFYDIYLSKHKVKNKIALCYEFQMLKTIPIDKNDEFVSKIITEERTIEVN